MKIRRFFRKSCAVFLSVVLLASGLCIAGVSAADQVVLTCGYETQLKNKTALRYQPNPCSDNTYLDEVQTIQQITDGGGRSSRGAMRLSYLSATPKLAGYRLFGDASLLANDKGAAGSLYTLSFWYSVQALSAAASLNVYYGSINWTNGQRADQMTNNLVDSRTLTVAQADGEWRYYEVPVFAGSVNGFHVALDMGTAAAPDGSCVLIDDVCITLRDSAAETVTITPDSRGGSAVSPVTGVAGLKVLLPTPEREGYLFAGWYSDKSCITELKVFPQKDATAYAGWIKAPTGENETVARLSVAFSDVALDYIHSLKGNASKAGTVTLTAADGSTLYSGALASFKGRGNASWSMAGEKRSYNMKLDKKAELVDGAGKAKSWCLIANNVFHDGENTDRTGLSNAVAYTLFQQLGGDAAVSFRPVELYITDIAGRNEEYRGLYMLVEKVQINKERVNITEAKLTEDETTRRVDDETADITAAEQALLDTGITSFQYCPKVTVQSAGGFLLEADSRYAGEASWFRTRHGAAFVSKEPEFINLAQMTEIATYVQGFEDALYSPTGYNAAGKHYTEYIDLDSLAKKFLLDCFTAQYDIFKTSCFFYVDGNDTGLVGKMKTGPAWDYDYEKLGDTTLYHYVGAGAEPDRCTRVWVEQLLTKGDFVDALYTLNEGTFKALLDTMVETTLPAYAAALQPAGARNGALWHVSFDDRAASYIQRFSNRVKIWNNTVWTADKLLGVQVAQAGNTLAATVKGSADSYQWYRVDPADPTRAYAVSGATEATLQPTVNGTYYVQVTGTPLGSGSTETGEPAGSVMVSAAVEYTGGADPSQLVTVTLDTMGGADMGSVEGLAGTPFTAATPVREGYAFTGWYSDAACTVLLEVFPATNATAYAGWRETTSSGLPQLEITLTDVDLNYIHAVKGNASKAGTVTLKGADGSTLYSGALSSFKGRGNASWTMASTKRSYNLKLSKKAELVEGAGKAKSWCLIASNVKFDGENTDRTGLSNAAAYTLYQQLGGDAALSFQPVELYITDPSNSRSSVYRGLYMLVEKVQINEERVNITEAKLTEDETTRLVNSGTADITAAEQALLDTGIRAFQYCPNVTVQSAGGFLLEADSRYASEASWFRTRRGAAFVSKEPEFINLAQMTQIAAYIQEFEDALYSPTGYNAAGRHYTDYVDMESLAKKFLLDCFSAQYDIFKTSSFFYIDGDDTGFTDKLRAGPAWDYDYEKLTDETLYHYVGTDTEPDRWTRVWVEQLLTKGDFVDALYDLNEGTFKALLAGMADTTLPQLRQTLAVAGARNGQKWNFDYAAYAANYITRFRTRVNTWNNTVWTADKLLGVQVTHDGNTLTATVNGAAGSYQWYRIDPTDPTAAVPVDGATGAVFTPTQEGRYYVRVTGVPIGAGPTQDGELAGTTMVSAAVAVSKPAGRRGDANGDGVVDAKDVTYLRRALAKWQGYTVDAAVCDLNGDGVVDAKDVTYLRRALAKWQGYTTG